MLRVCLLLLCALAASAPLPTDPGLPIEARAHALIRAATPEAAAAVAAAIGGVVVRASAVPGHFLAEMHPDRPAHPAVEYVTDGFEPLTRDVMAAIGSRPLVPVPFMQRDAVAPEWTLAVLNARAAWGAGAGAGAVVVVPDSGSDWTHIDLARVDGAHALNVQMAGQSAMPPVDEAHGTMAASCVVAADNGVCGTGVAPGATVVPVRMLMLGVPLTVTQIAEALVYAPTGAAAAVSNSWGPNDYVPSIAELATPLLAALDALRARNTTVLFAAGNGYQYGDHMSNDGFASHRYTLAVGALGYDGRAAPYSEAGAVAVAAPSSNDYVGVTAARPDGQCTSGFGGTSAATPQIAGVVALLRPAAGAAPLTPTDVLDVLVHAAQANQRVISVNEPAIRNAAGLVYSTRLGFGVPDAAVAVALAANRTARWAPVDVAAPLDVSRPYLAYGTSALSAVVAADGTVVWAAAVLGLELGRCSMARVQAISLESPAGTVVPVYERSYLHAVHSLVGHALPTRAFHGERAAGTWKVRVDHECQPSILVTADARIELLVVE